MGALTSRQNVGNEEIDISSFHVYKYPPKSGNYFGDHFIMGGEKFDISQPESYLFGENSDLNFLGTRPSPFPYPQPQNNEPTKTLISRVNIRKESLRLVKVNNSSCIVKNNDTITKLNENTTSYNIEFIFDTDCDITITIYYFVREEITPNGMTFVKEEKSFNSKTYNYKVGANQLFYQSEHVFNPSKFTTEELTYDTENEIIPIVVHCVTNETNDVLKESHTTFGSIERHSDGSYVLKSLKQKIFIDGLCYLLQEIYGIENKQYNIVKNNCDIDIDDDNNSECVICMCDIRDTLILPCRHLCLCHSCADSLRYQANNCPICRSPFRALLQIKALRKQSDTTENEKNISNDKDLENRIPNGFESVTLIEALNGPFVKTNKEKINSEKSKRNNKLTIDDENDDKNIANCDVDSSPLLFIKRNKDMAKIINECKEESLVECSININQQSEEIDEEIDSDAEKLSPLLNSNDNLNESSSSIKKSNSANDNDLETEVV